MQWDATGRNRAVLPGNQGLLPDGKIIAGVCSAVIQYDTLFCRKGNVMSQKPSVETPTTALPERGGVLDQADALLEALTADKDRLFNVIRNSREEVLLAALRNPSLDHQHLLALLKRREIGAVITALYAGKRLLEAYSVKFALVAHPDTPCHIAQALLPLLYIFDLLKLCLLPGVSADIHLAAERKIIQQISAQPLGNKLTLARRGTVAILDALLRDGGQNLLEACLDNPHLKEGSLYQFLASSHATAESVSMVARNSRWNSRPNIRLAILKNPRTPLVWFTVFLPGLPSATLRDLLASPRLTLAQKELVRQARPGSLR